MKYALVAIVFIACRASSREWPAIQAFRDSLIVLDGQDAATGVTILSPDGGRLYSVDCRTQSDQESADFDFSGDFECRLRSLYSDESYSTLFTDLENPTRDWQSRARFLADELVGARSDYPEYGRVRNFRLRGMRITLALSDVLFDTTVASSDLPARLSLRSFRFDISVVPDTTAASAIAEPVPYAEPVYLQPDDLSDRRRACDRGIERAGD